jgi:hypothetical protein
VSCATIAFVNSARRVRGKRLAAIRIGLARPGLLQLQPVPLSIWLACTRIEPCGFFQLLRSITPAHRHRCKMFLLPRARGPYRREDTLSATSSILIVERILQSQHKSLHNATFWMSGRSDSRRSRIYVACRSMPSSLTLGLTRRSSTPTLCPRRSLLVNVLSSPK